MVFNKIIKKIAKGKLFLQRAKGYLEIINLSMIFFVFLNSANDLGLNINIKIFYIPLLIFSLSALFFLGYLDYTKGVYKEEIRAIWKINPHWKDLHERLDNLERLIKNEKNNKRNNNCMVD